MPITSGVQKNIGIIPGFNVLINYCSIRILLNFLGIQKCKSKWSKCEFKANQTFQFHLLEISTLYFYKYTYTY